MYFKIIIFLITIQCRINGLWCDGTERLNNDQEGCKENFYTCNDGTCINETLLCNDIVDCPTGEDEDGCVRSINDELVICAKTNANCTCEELPNSREVVSLQLDCTITKLDSVPKIIHREFNTINLRVNKISKLKPRSFKGMKHLKYLALGGNEIDTIEIGAFEGLNNLSGLDLDYNNIEKLTPAMWEQLTELEALALGYNKISVIENHTFKNLKNLKKLYLDHNKITSLTPEIFKNLISLSTLNLNANQIKTIENNVFIGLKNLNTLVLSENEISNLTSGTFENLKDLEELELSKNEIRHIENNTFRGCVNVKTLNLNGNKISHLSSTIFKDLGQSRDFFLHLEENQIQTIEEDTFLDMHALKVLTLSGNKITNFTSRSFKKYEHHIRDKENKNLSPTDINQDYIFQLNLGKNSLVTIESYTFYDWRIRSRLILRDNKIQQLKSRIFANLTELSYLELQNNQIATVENDTFEGLRTLQSLNLSGNEISKLTLGTFNGLKQLRNLNLNRNKIEHIESGTFRDLNRLDRLDLSNNDITKLSSGMFEGLYVLQVDAMTSLCWEKHITNSTEGRNYSSGQDEQFTSDSLLASNLRGNETNTIEQYWPALDLGENESEMTLETEFADPLSLLYWKKYIIESTEGRNYSFDKDEQFFLDSLLSLNLRGNKIDTIENYAFRNQQYLSVLDLSENKISTLSAETFDGLDQLQILNLRKNGIRFVGSRTFDQLESLVILDVTENPAKWMNGDFFAKNKCLKYLDADENFLCCSPQNPKCYGNFTTHEFSLCDEVLMLQDDLYKIYITAAAIITILLFLHVVIFRKNFVIHCIDKCILSGGK